MNRDELREVRTQDLEHLLSGLGRPHRAISDTERHAYAADIRDELAARRVSGPAAR